MIVNLTQDGWQVIYHRAHALLAAELAGHWHRDNVPERFYETIAAISHHDDLEKEWEGDELTEAGAPLDFTLGRGDSTEPLRQHLLDARYRGRWVTLLTSKHISYLSQDKWGSSKEWDQFLNEQVENQEKWSKELGVEKDEVERAYQFMLWCDRLSLILAQNQVPEDQRSLEITSGIDNQRYDIRQLSNGHLTIEPWPFEEEFTVNVEASCLSELKFNNNDALVKALQSAPIKILTWTFSEKE
ncbi:DUF3891 family protein [Phormidium sp. CLA17]|uniref:DUF3891 family protein n=1 Tax=Leptolyngbya sp. Cla-17 TaxID=2803751 RepID=UPI0014928F79|nr:DUF3891 family protein [Leptolyngbya sp. Cla-17]MBM0742024.1 DUF3891 family protein [Leptolyngbya sp. Cla-17]